MMKHIGIVDITTVGACLCANRIVAKSAELDSSCNHPEFSMHAYPFKKYIDLINQRNWDDLADVILQSIEKLKLSGAEFIIIPSNTPHFAIDKIQRDSPLVILSMLEIVADECKRRGFQQVAMLGTKFTMQGGLYSKVLEERGIKHVIPDTECCERIHNFIINEIIPSKINTETTQHVANDIRNLSCDAVVLACTELPVIYNEKNLGMPVIDTTRLIAEKALEYALMPKN